MRGLKPTRGGTIVNFRHSRGRRAMQKLTIPPLRVPQGTCFRGNGRTKYPWWVSVRPSVRPNHQLLHGVDTRDCAKIDVSALMLLLQSQQPL